MAKPGVSMDTRGIGQRVSGYRLCGQFFGVRAKFRCQVRNGIMAAQVCQHHLHYLACLVEDLNLASPPRTAKERCSSVSSARQSRWFSWGLILNTVRVGSPPSHSTFPHDHASTLVTP